MDEQLRNKNFQPDKAGVSRGSRDICGIPSHLRLIQHVFENHASRTPDSIALISSKISLTYAELNSRANRVAQVLLALGIRPDQRVGICAERSVDTVIAYLGILKAGAAYLPLDPAYPIQRLQFMIEDGTPAALLIQQPFRDKFSSCAVPLLSLDETVAGSCDENPLVAGLHSASSAYVIYTSGSTGAPKGVIVEHRNVLGLVTNASYAPLGPADSVAHCASPSFDATTWEVWGPLLNGARVVVIPQSALLDPITLNSLLTRHSVSALFLTVRLFNEYVDALEDAFGRLRYLLVGGEVLSPGMVRRVLSKPKPPQNLINAYGPTETTTFACTFPISKIVPSGSTIPIGMPIAGATVVILNTKREAVPVGTVGEIFIGGSGVARGYLNRPALTAERFQCGSLVSRVGQRLYRTGDMARWRSDGQIDYVGRTDNQVKIRGYRIELEEVEAQLARHEQVQNAAVIAREDDRGHRRLVAYVVLGPLTTMSVAHLRAYLNTLLPEFMVPEAFVILQKMPLTPNGKIDKQALPEPDFRAYACEQYEVPEGEVEEKLARLWQDVLHATRVGRNDDFFAIGGDSIALIDMIGRVGKTFARVSIQDVFRNPSVRSLAKIIESRRSNAEDQPVIDESLDEFTL